MLHLGNCGQPQPFSWFLVFVVVMVKNESEQSKSPNSLVREPPARGAGWKWAGRLTGRRGSRHNFFDDDVCCDNIQNPEPDDGQAVGFSHVNHG